MKTLKLKDRELKRLDYGHWWIFSNELEKIDTTIQKGEICSFVYSNSMPCGIGFFNPNSLISGRLLVKNTFSLDENFVEERIKRAFEYRKDLNLEKNCRLFFGESDFIGGLIIDKYGDVFVVEILSAGVDLLKDKIIEAIKKLFSPKAIIIKRDHQYRLLEGLTLEKEEIIGKIPSKIVLEENKAKFKIDFLKGQKTGWYFDQRENREFLIPFFENKKVLDLYCYTGSFSILASKNNADMVWGIDSSENAIEIAKENIKLNKLDEEKIIFKQENVEKVLDALEKEELPIKPNFILLDPPNFIRSKKNLEQGIKLYIRLLSKAIRGIDSNGYLSFSTCSQHITREIFEDIIKRASYIAKRKVYFLEFKFQSKDHPIIVGMNETRYLNFSFLKVL